MDLPPTPPCVWGRSEFGSRVEEGSSSLPEGLTDSPPAPDGFRVGCCRADDTPGATKRNTPVRRLWEWIFKEGPF